MRKLFAIALLIPSIMGSAELTYCPLPPSVNTFDTAAEKCLATMIYGEARGETIEGMVAVAYTALNRAAKKTVCGVVLAPKQYSIFNNNPALKAAALSLDIEPKQKNVIDSASWKRAMNVAEVVLNKALPDPTAGSTHYLAPIVMKAKGYTYPRWSREYKLVAIIDNHRFYKK